MKPIFDTNTSTIISGFNFISKATANIAGQIQLSSTDRIIARGSDMAVTIWNKLMNDNEEERSKGYKVCYNRYFEDEKLDFRLFSTELPYNLGLVSNSIQRFTRDDTGYLSIAISDISSVTSSDERWFTLLHSIFRQFLQLFITFTGNNIDNVVLGRFLDSVSDTFTLLTGEFDERFEPEAVDKSILDIVDIMYDDNVLVYSSKDNAIQIGENDHSILKLLQYFEQIYNGISINI